MAENRLTEIEHAIGTLSRQELQELLSWLDEYASPQLLDRRIETDLGAGRLDEAVQEALNDERHGRVRPL
jgi:hypothetical protein